MKVDYTRDFAIIVPDFLATCYEAKLNAILNGSQPDYSNAMRIQNNIELRIAASRKAIWSSCSKTVRIIQFHCKIFTVCVV